MKKLLYIGAGLLILLVLAAFIIPSFIDPNQYKTEIETKFKAGTGYQLDIKGDISVSVLPFAKASIDGVQISNNSKALANIEQIVAYPKLIPLLSGNVQIDSIKIKGAVIELAKTESGYSWDKLEPAGDKKPIEANVDDTKKKNLDLKIDSIKIEDGKITFADQVKGKTYRFTDINIDSSLGSMKGPVEFDANLKYNNMPLSAKGNVDNFENPKISFTSNLMGSEISYQGALAGGKLSMQSKDIGPLADLLGSDAAKQYANIPVNISADVNYTKEKADIQNIKLLVGETTGEGNVVTTMSPESTFADVNFKFSTINVDQLMPKGKEKTDEEPVKKKEEEPKKSKPLNTKINLSAATVIYGGQQYKNLLVNSEVENGTVVMQPVNIGLPGGGRAEVYGVLSSDTLGQSFDGHLNVNSDNFREVLKSFKITPTGAKQDALGKMVLDADLIVNIRDNVKADLSNTSLQLDNTTFKGSVSVDTATPAKVNISGAINQLDLNKYVDTSAKKEVPVESKANTSINEDPIQFTWLDKLPIQGNANLNIGSITYGEDTYTSIRVNADYKPSVLNINEVSAASKKIQLSAKGWINSTPGKKAKIGVEANIGKLNLADFISKNPEADAAEAAKPKPANKTRWSQEPYDLSPLRKIDVDFKANIASLIYNKMVLDNLYVGGYLQDGKFVVEKSTGNLFGGEISMSANVAAAAVPSMSLAISGTDVDLYKALTTLANNERVQGKASMNLSVSSSGVSQMSMISNLTGGISISSSEILVKGFDLKGLAAQVTNINDISGVIGIARTLSGEQAVTYINAVKGGATIEKGVATIQEGGISMEVAGAGNGKFTGKADILNWNMDTNANFKLLTPDQKERPGVGIHIYGPLDDPKKDINLDEVKRYVAERATKLLLKKGVISEKNAELLQPGGLENRANEEINKGLGKLLGGNKKDNGKSNPTQDLLKGMMGGGQAQQPTAPAPSVPAQAPATSAPVQVPLDTTPAPAAPATPAPAEAAPAAPVQ